MPAERLVSVPDGVSDMMAAAVILKGTTAYYLLHDTFPVGSGTVVLVYAAAGGVGSLLCQWARHLGATVIGAVGSEEKIDLARSNGCHHVILSRPREIASQVRAFTGGTGCDVVYDGIGRDTFADSLDCLRPRGLLASFGSASGPVVGVELGLLAKKGSLFVTRPTGRDYLGTASELQRAAASVFDAVAANVLRVKIHAEYPLRAAARAHRDLERRATTGSLVLRP
jgi:NADPH2:quinone reductase